MQRLTLAILFITTLATGPTMAEGFLDDRYTCWKGRGKPELVIAACTRILQSNKFKKKALPLGYLLRGNAFARKRAYDQAIADYDRAITLDPKYASAYLSRGRTYGRKGDLDQAIANFNRAIAIWPRSIIGYMNRGFAYSKNGKFDLAVADYSRAIALKPKNARAYLYRGIVFGKKGDHDRAAIDFDRAIILQPKYGLAYYNRGLAYGRQKLRGKSIKDFDRTIKLMPKFYRAYVFRGWNHKINGDFRRAILDYRTVLKLKSDNSWTIRNLAWLLATAPSSTDRNGSQAVQLALQALEVGKNKTFVLSILAAAYAETGQFAKAVAVQRWAVERLYRRKAKPGKIKQNQYRLELFNDARPYRK